MTLWAITAYFNPMRYQQRRRNYQLFRRALTVPLVTVELGYGGRFELGTGDADLLVQRYGEAVLWQKERLLNVALQHVPMEVQHIAWLDCDVTLERDDWATTAVECLGRFPLVQLFDQLYDLGRDALPADVALDSTAPTARSIAFRMATGSATTDDFRPPSTRRLRSCSFGLGWAARRELLDAHGFYDALILGSGDRAMACAAYGRFEDAIHTARLDDQRARHYLTWARPYFDTVRGHVGFLEGRVFHLWHGDVAHRRYVERHDELAKLGFNPFADVAVDAQGGWRWASSKPALQEYVAGYFASRREDGEPVSEG